MTNDELREQIIEQALIALTYVKYNSQNDREKAQSDLEPLHKAYTADEVNAGAMVILQFLLRYEADLLEISLDERIDNIRALFQGRKH